MVTGKPWCHGVPILSVNLVSPCVTVSIQTLLPQHVQVGTRIVLANSSTRSTTTLRTVVHQSNPPKSNPYRVNPKRVSNRWPMKSSPVTIETATPRGNTHLVSQIGYTKKSVPKSTAVPE